LSVNWRYGKLSDALEKGSSNLSLKKIEGEEGEYPVFGAKGLVKKVSFFQQQSEYLSVIKDGAGIGRITCHPAKSSVLATMQYLLPRDGFDIQFLAYFLRRVDFEKYRTGSTIPHIYYKDYKNEPVPLLTLSEQVRIVEILDEAFTAITTATTNTEKNLANARELFDSFLAVQLDTVATSTTTQTLTELTELIVDCEHKTAPTQDTGYPSIRTPNIGRGHLILEGVKRVSKEVYQAWTRRARPQPGDLILAREAPAGNVSVIPEHEIVCLGQRTVLIRPDRSVVDSEYLAFLLLHPAIQARLLSHSTGATVQHVNLRDIRGLALGLLPSISIQRNKVAHLNEVRQKVNQLTANKLGKVAYFSNLKDSILHKAFTGELTTNAKAADRTLSEAGV